MGSRSKSNFHPEGSVKDLPPHLDALLEGRTPRNMRPAEVFHEYPALSMIAQIITDYILTNHGLEKDDIRVLLQEDADIAAITFDARPEYNGSIDVDIQATLLGALAEFEKIIIRTSIDDVVSVSMSNLCVGANADKAGFLQLLHEFALDRGYHIGPAPEGGRRKSIGAFTLGDIQGAILREKAIVRDLGQAFQKALKQGEDALVPPRLELSPRDAALVRAQDITNNFTEILDEIIGKQVFEFVMTPRASGEFRYIIWPKEFAGNKAVQFFFDQFSGDDMPDGVHIAQEDWLFRMADVDAFQRLYDFTVNKFGNPAPAVDADADKGEEEAETEDEENNVILWKRSQSRDATDMVCDILYGLSKFHFGLDHTDWSCLYHNGEYTFSPIISADEKIEHSKLMHMMRQIATEGGAWQGLGIDAETGAIITSDIRMICNMLDQYAEKNEMTYGTQAIDRVHISTPPENFLVESDAYLKADPSLMMALGNRTYNSRQDMLIDIEKLVQSVIGRTFIAPHTTDDVFRALVRPQEPVLGVHYV